MPAGGIKGAALHVVGSADTRPKMILATLAAVNIASAIDGAGETFTVTVPGAVLGDFALAAMTSDISVGNANSPLLTASVTAANTVKVRFQNESTATLDPVSGTLRVLVIKI